MSAAAADPGRRRGAAFPRRDGRAPPPASAGEVRATYRLQLGAGVDFAGAAGLVPYLDGLGISHLYVSPIMAARSGSTHGYDVVDFNRLNPALGTEAELRALARALAARGMGLIVDFVPNHMGIGGSENRAWLSVLERGPDSPFAAWFDIDWTAVLPGPAGHRNSGKVLVPFLGDHYGAVLAQGGLVLRCDAEGLAVWAHGQHRLPIRPQDYATVLRAAPGFEALAEAAAAAAGGAGWPALLARLSAADLGPVIAAYAGRPGEIDSWARLDGLIAEQFWRASRYTLDGDAINYRRFFTISDLAGVRVEEPAVFDATHAFILRLLREGVVAGLRIDHIDGLWDPAGYLRRLRAAVGRPFPLYVEKILGPGEALPADWPCDGTTGYDFANEVTGLLADPAGVRTLGRIYPQLTGQHRRPARIVEIAKAEVMAYPMAAELEALTARFLDLASRDPTTADLGRAPIRAGLAAVVAALDVYRTYADARGLSAADRARIEAAVARARGLAPELGPDVFDFIAAVLTLDLARDRPGDAGDILAAAMRVQQFTGPVMAKGLEDKALYRHARLIAFNEVGGDPGRPGLTAAAFHRLAAARGRHWPRAMLAGSTHDTKRGEDARARILAIAGHAETWRRAVTEWQQMLADAAAPIAPNEAYFFFQMLVGAWPADWADDGGNTPEAAAAPDAAALDALRRRLAAAMVKSAREAGVNTRWLFGDPAYEAALERFVARALDPAPDNAFLPSFCAFARRIARDGKINALIQLALKLTLPGVPDIFQGAELWEQSLVDPDNRRPVDFDRVRALLAARAPTDPLWTPEMPGAVAKFNLTAGLLALRRDRPELFARGSYRPVRAHGPAGPRFFGFVRRWRDQRLAVLAALGPAPEPAGAETAAWADTRLVLPPAPPGVWLNLVDRSQHDTPVPARLFAAVPLALLVRP